MSRNFQLFVVVVLLATAPEKVTAFSGKAETKAINVFTSDEVGVMDEAVKQHVLNTVSNIVSYASPLWRSADIYSVASRSDYNSFGKMPDIISCYSIRPTSAWNICKLLRDTFQDGGSTSTVRNTVFETLYARFPSPFHKPRFTSNLNIEIWPLQSYQGHFSNISGLQSTKSSVFRGAIKTDSREGQNARENNEPKSEECYGVVRCPLPEGFATITFVLFAVVFVVGLLLMG